MPGILSVMGKTANLFPNVKLALMGLDSPAVKQQVFSPWQVPKMLNCHPAALPLTLPLWYEAET